MSAHRLPRFTNPDWLKSIAGVRLIRFFEPYRSYLLQRGFSLPHDALQLIDLEMLAAIVIDPDDTVPGAMVEALYYMHEMACIEQMDDLIAASRSRGLLIDAGPEVSPADIAVQVWLQYPDLLREQHAGAYAMRQKSFTYFAGQGGSPRPFPHPTPATLKRLEAELDEWFDEHKRGRDCRVFIFDQSSKILIVVRHGLPFRREGSRREGKSAIEFYRPEIHDVLIYDPEFDELGVHVHSRTLGERKLYLETIGFHFFSDREYFPTGERFTLSPLVERGPAALACEDVPGLESIKLVGFQRFWGGAYKDKEIREATDIFAICGEGRRISLAGGELKRATFSVKMQGELKPRKVTIRPPNIAIYDRDSDSEPVEIWLRRQGFIIGQENEPDALPQENVVRPRDHPGRGDRSPGMEANP